MQIKNNSKMYQLQINIKFILIMLFLHLACLGRLNAQLKSGSYIGESNGFVLTIKPDKSTVLYYRYETSVSFRFDCRLTVDSDSTFSLTNLARVADTIIILKTRRRKVEDPEIHFKDLNRAGQYRKTNIEYRIAEKSGGREIQFSYNHRDYVYNISYNAKKVLIVIDLGNSFFLGKWGYSGDSLFPIVRNEVVTKWVSVLK
jgi:hypothetical protein